MLARGVRLDWFNSTEIVIECLIAALAFYVFIVHSLGARAPFLNLKLLTDRNYAIGLALVTIYGMLNFTPMVLLPPLLQQHVGFSDALVGQVIGCRGIGMLVGFLAAGFMSRIDPRISMAFGFGLQTVAGLWMLTFDLNVTMEILVVNSAIQGFAVGVVWVPITVVAFDTLEAKDYAEASSIFHLLRNIGSSFFISLSIAEIVRTTGANYSRMTEMITPYNRALATPGLTGAWNFDTRAGPCQGRQGDHAPVGDDRLSQCVHDVHGGIGARGGVRPDGPPPPAAAEASRLEAGYLPHRIGSHHHLGKTLRALVGKIRRDRPRVIEPDHGAARRFRDHVVVDQRGAGARHHRHADADEGVADHIAR